MKTLVWLRNDLRLGDNPALFHAAENRQGVTAVYLLCDEFLVRHGTAPARLDFVRRHLELLQPRLSELNIPLVFLRCASASEIPAQLLALARREHCGQLFFNAEYPLDELQRDRLVTSEFNSQGISFKRFHDRVIIPPGMLRNGQGEPYRVFTAFKKSWLKKAVTLPLQPHGLPARQPEPVIAPSDAREWPLDRLFKGLVLRDLASLWPAGEDEALARLKAFVSDGIDDYHQWRDFPIPPVPPGAPARENTSRLSPYLAIGAISSRQCLSAALNHNHGEWYSGGEGPRTWIGELIWRDFYQHVTVDFPRVCQYQAMQAHTEAFPWQRDEARLNAWRRGQTGIPIVDAAMRQLLATGWMHNRLRMVVAMFLTKNLQMDWRLGEAWFMSQLIDGDFAANNGGWQWSASTGTDAAPYFRIFNPVTQSQRFDPNGEFIRTYVPELTHLSERDIHQPPPTAGYPEPMVDLKASRKATIELFGQLGQRGRGKTQL